MPLKNVCWSNRYKKFGSELSCPQYTWHFIKKTTRTERVACGAALAALILCIALTVYLKVYANKELEEPPDNAPHEWNITREMWLAAPRLPNPEPTTEPLKMVIIQHTVSSECSRFKICAAEIRNLQTYFLTKLNYDIPYNFLVGNDGRVYEGRGWGQVAAHTVGFNRCSLGIGFIGDYRQEMPVHSKVTELQVNRTMMLLEAGVELGYLDPDYVIAAAKDLQATESPGSNLYNEMQKWHHYDGQKYANKNCTQIQQSKK